MTKLTGKRLNRELALGAEHARYHKDGYWYDQLHRFPGVLFDSKGYISFANQAAYRHCAQLRSDGRPGTLSVPGGISRIPGYVQDKRIAELNQ